MSNTGGPIINSNPNPNSGLPNTLSEHNNFLTQQPPMGMSMHHQMLSMNSNQQYPPQQNLGYNNPIPNQQPEFVYQPSMQPGVPSNMFYPPQDFSMPPPQNNFLGNFSRKLTCFSQRKRKKSKTRKFEIV